MTQTTGFPAESSGANEANPAPRPQHAGPAFVYDPWARPTTPGLGGDHAAPATPAAPGVQPGPAATPQPATAPIYSGYPTAPGAQSPVGYAPEPTRPETAGPARRGPGWVALGAASLSAAVLASLLTAGAMQVLDDGSSPRPSSFSATSTAPAGPVQHSTAANPDWQAVAASVSQSVVAIQVSSGQGGGQGSGVVLDTEGHVVTNNHVVAGGQKITVIFSDGRGYSASIVGTDPSTDLAVVKLDSPPSGLKPIALGDSEAVKVGDPVMAVGNPLGLSNTVTTGIVSALNRPVTTRAESQEQPADPFGFNFGQAPQVAEPVVTNAIQHDASVNPGNSGGALVDVQGRLIGINSSIATLGSGGRSGSIGISFSIPGNLAKSVADEIIATGKASHAWLGVNLAENVVTVDGAQYQAAVIGEVVQDSPAAKASLKPNDAIIAINGEQVNGAESLTAQIRERKPGTEVTVTVVRDGKKLDVPVTLGTRPEN